MNSVFVMVNDDLVDLKRTVENLNVDLGFHQSRCNV